MPRKGHEFFQIEGVNETIANLHKIHATVAKPAVASGIRAGLRTINKGIKSQIKHPSVRRTISHRFKRGKGSDHRIFAKVGGSVGRKGNVHNPKFGRTRGAHISKQNAHWYFIGTKIRYIKTGPRAGQYTGKMWGKTARPEPVKIGFAKSRGAAIRNITRQMKADFIKRMKRRIKVKGFRRGFFM